MYITIEGVDSVGKTTQYNLLKKYFPKAIFTQEPYDRSVIDKVLKLKTKKCIDNAFVNDRVNHENDIIKPNIFKNKLIISDRSCISGYAYSYNKSLDHFYECIKPNYVFLFKTNNGERFKRKINNDLDNLTTEKVLELQENMIKFINKFRIKHQIINCFDKHYNISYSLVSKIIEICNDHNIAYQ